MKKTFLLFAMACFALAGVLAQNGGIANLQVSQRIGGTGLVYFYKNSGNTGVINNHGCFSQNVGDAFGKVLKSHNPNIYLIWEKDTINQLEQKSLKTLGFYIAPCLIGFSMKTREKFSHIYFKGQQLPLFDLGVADVDSASVFKLETIPQMGISLGIILDHRLNKHFNLRFIPGITYGSRLLRYDTQLFRETDTINRVLEKNINSTFVDLPLTLKYAFKQFQSNNLHIFTGFKYSFDLNSKAHIVDHDYYTPKLLRHDSFILLGAGIDFYMNWFKLGIEFSMLHGLKEMLVRENNLYTEGIESLRSEIFMLSFTFK
jgi:hypothetical protein